MNFLQQRKNRKLSKRVLTQEKPKDNYNCYQFDTAFFNPKILNNTQSFLQSNRKEVFQPTLKSRRKKRDIFDLKRNYESINYTVKDYAKPN